MSKERTEVHVSVKGDRKQTEVGVTVSFYGDSEESDDRFRISESQSSNGTQGLIGHEYRGPAQQSGGLLSEIGRFLLSIFGDGTASNQAERVEAARLRTTRSMYKTIIDQNGDEWEVRGIMGPGETRPSKVSLRSGDRIGELTAQQFEDLENKRSRRMTRRQ